MTARLIAPVSSSPSHRVVFAGALLSLLIATLGSTAIAQEQPPILGDVDGDRVIILADLLAVRQAIDGLIQLPPDAAARADVNQDGVLDELDYTAMIFPALEANSGSPFQSPHDPLPRITSISPSFGPPGTSVTVVGTDFGSSALANAIRIGETPAAIISATPTQAVFKVPDGESGRLVITNHESGLSSACHSFVIASTETPDYDPELPVGEVMIGVPAEVPLPNGWFTVPVAARLPSDIELGSIGIMMSFDPEHVEVIEVLATVPDFLSPMPPCIDNASGLLGSGAIRKTYQLKSQAASISDQTLSLFSVVFKCISYRHEAPEIVARLETLTDSSYPAKPLGAAMPRFVSNTATAFPPVIEHPLGMALAEIPLAETPRISLSEEGSNFKNKTVLEAENHPTSKTASIPYFDFIPSTTNKITTDTITVKSKTSSRSAVLMILDTDRGVFSNLVDCVAPGDLTPPKVTFSLPFSGASFVPGTDDILIAFSEALNSLSIANHGVQVSVTSPDGTVSNWGMSSNVTPYFKSAIHLRPVLPFPDGATIEVTLTGLQDLNGNTMAPTQLIFSS